MSSSAVEILITLYQVVQVYTLLGCGIAAFVHQTDVIDILGYIRQVGIGCITEGIAAGIIHDGIGVAGLTGIEESKRSDIGLAPYPAATHRSDNAMTQVEVGISQLWAVWHDGRVNLVVGLEGVADAVAKVLANPIGIGHTPVQVQTAAITQPEPVSHLAQLCSQIIPVTLCRIRQEINVGILGIQLAASIDRRQSGSCAIVFHLVLDIDLLELNVVQSLGIENVSRQLISVAEFEVRCLYQLT